MGSFQKLHGGFVDITPGVTCCDCWFLHLLFGLCYSRYHYIVNGGDDFIRNQERWAFNPRFGVGVQWAFCRCLTAGFEWCYNFPSDVVYRTPDRAGMGTDDNYRTERVGTNQIVQH